MSVPTTIDLVAIRAVGNCVAVKLRTDDVQVDLTEQYSNDEDSAGTYIAANGCDATLLDCAGFCMPMPGVE